MSRDQPNAKDILADALELPPEGREGYVREKCAGNAELTGKLLSLLRSAEAAPAGFLAPTHEHQALVETVRSAGTGREQSGQVIDRYRLLQVIGEGGFGTVWLAEQRAPVKRRVALKVIKLGMDTAQVIARFEAERQALAMMDHPNIARVLDAGSTATGRPYFVMEYIQGIPIVEYCNKHIAKISARLSLFTQVCQAIQHAHQKGIIHRDIKPNNVLVALDEGQPVPRVIDFGIAKATNAELTARTLFTEQGLLIGTPAYMSPEQAEMSGLDIDTRSDIYSLGVLLYELLTGTTPFDSTQTLRRVGFVEMMRVIREEEPQRPSAISKCLTGDLDWIVMKCLEKDRLRRYDSVSGLAADIRRHLHDEPVLAGPPSASYRLRKFVKRHRGAVLACSAIAVTLVLGMVGTSLGLVSALREKQRADAQAALATKRAGEAEQARAEATRRAQELEVIADFQSSQLAAVDAAAMGDRLRQSILDAAPASKREALRDRLASVNFTNIALASLELNVLAPSIEAIDNQFADQPLIRAKLLETVAVTLHKLGLLDMAMAPLERAVAIRRTTLGEGHHETLAAMNRTTELLIARGEFEAAERSGREALRIARDLPDAEHPAVLASIAGMGFVLESQGKLEEAEPYYREALELFRRVLGDEHPSTLSSINNMGFLLQSKGNVEEAERYYREALDGRRRVLGDAHPLTLVSVNNMGYLLMSQGKLEDAEPYFRVALESRRRVLGDDHPVTLSSINNMGFLLQLEGRLSEAELYYREALASRRRVLGEDDVNTLTSLTNMASLLHAQGKLEEAEPYCCEALESTRRVLGTEDRRTLTAMINMGALLNACKRYDESEPLAREFVETGARVLGPDNWRVAEAKSILGEALAGRGDFEEAETLLLAAYDALEKSVPAERRRQKLPPAAQRLVRLYEVWGRSKPAEQWRARATVGSD